MKLDWLSRNDLSQGHLHFLTSDSLVLLSLYSPRYSGSTSLFSLLGHRVTRLVPMIRLSLLADVKRFCGSQLQWDMSQ